MDYKSKQHRSNSNTTAKYVEKLVCLFIVPPIVGVTIAIAFNAFWIGIIVGVCILIAMTNLGAEK